MKNLDDLLLLGDERLYQKAFPVTEADKDTLPIWIADLDNVMRLIREKYHFGRAIAAPQLGILKQLIYMKIDEPKVFINPKIVFKSEELFEVWDDCMCFPNLLVKVLRHQNIKVEYLDINFLPQSIEFSGSLSELFQHEFDHLNGILCTMRALDSQSFKWRMN